MNMTLSKRGDYVVRSALALARAWPSGEQRKIREVVAEMGVPPTFASQILADLVRAGLAVSKAGKDGGYRLARPPEEISILSVVEAGEGPLRSERCALGDGPCRWDAVCPLHETWRAATDALRLALEASTLAELAERDRMLGDGEVGAPADSHRHGTTSVEVEDWISGS
jgi:Rrf2 family protein